MMVEFILRAVALKSQSLDVFHCWFALFFSMFSTGSVYVLIYELGRALPAPVHTQLQVPSLALFARTTGRFQLATPCSRSASTTCQGSC
jgi:hypothetical protein